MKTRNHNTVTTIHTKGALLPIDLLRISENDTNLEGLTTEVLAPESLREDCREEIDCMNMV